MLKTEIMDIVARERKAAAYIAECRRKRNEYIDKLCDINIILGIILILVIAFWPIKADASEMESETELSQDFVGWEKIGTETFSIGVCTNANGDGMLLYDSAYPVDPNYNYIAYRYETAREVKVGDVVLTHYMWYGEDNFDRLSDEVLWNVYDDIK